MFWGKQNSRELSFRQIFCAGMWCKTFFVPIDAAFASGLICILVHRADLLLLLLAGLYWPDKTWSFKKFDVFAVLPCLVFFPYVFFPFFFFGVSCSFFPLSPFQAGALLYTPNPISFLVLSLLSASPLGLILVFIECSYRSWRIWVK